MDRSHAQSADASPVAVSESPGAELRRTQDMLAQANRDFADLAVPIITVWDGVLAVPLVGTLDSLRAQDTMERALLAMSNEKARVLILDITGVPAFDSMVAQHLLQIASAVRLMGCECILTGITPSTAITIVSLGLDLTKLNTRPTLAQGLQLALAMDEKRKLVE